MILASMGPMFLLLCRCIACESGLDPRIDRSSFPLCSLCHLSLGSLEDCPELCPNCAGPLCLTTPERSCTRPWIYRPQIQSYSARYLLFKNTYQVLKRWKSRRGLLFDRKVLVPSPRLTSHWKGFDPEAIVPIPQRFERSWKMGGSRAELLAQWVSSQTEVPVRHLLSIPESFHQAKAQKRQAQLNLEERLKNSIRFLGPDRRMQLPKRVILVDDFLTTGHTLAQGAQALQIAGVEKIHAFSLGVRVRIIHGDKGI